MSTGKRKHLPVSVRQHLRNLRDKTGEDYQLLLTTYAVERLLYRLSQSKYADRFVLKGAMLFVALTGKPHRVTRDLEQAGNTIRYGETAVRGSRAPEYIEDDFEEEEVNHHISTNNRH